MQKIMVKALGIFMLALLIMSTTGAAATYSCGKNTKTVTVAGDGSGDFNCDGKNDHVQINQALAFAVKNPGTTVHLKGPFKYVIGDTLLIGSNTILEGGSGVTIKLARGLPVWGGRKSSIAKEKAMLMIKGNSANNVIIKRLSN
jgi:hypothetical protein